MLIIAFTLVKVYSFLIPRSVYVTGDLPVSCGEITPGLFSPEASSSVYVTGDLLVEFYGDVFPMLPSPARWTVTKGAWLSGDLFGYFTQES